MHPTRTILHVDMDAFYASVEQRDHPEYRGRPVVVGSDPKEGRGRGVVAACSYEARVYGIHSALPIGRAWRLCPRAVFVRPRGRAYAEASRAVFAVFDRYTDRVEPLSIDEAFLDLTGTERLAGPAIEVAARIRTSIRAATGLTASAGLAPNKFLAKVASDLEKPDGFVVVRPGEERVFLDPLPLRRLWGVGPATARALEVLGVRTVGDLTQWPRVSLEGRFGDLGGRLWELSRGIDQRPVEAGRDPKSLGAEHTFDEDVADVDRVRHVLLRLADRVGARLRRRSLVAGGVTLKLRDDRFHTITRTVKLGEPTDLGGDLFGEVVGLLEQIPLGRGRKVRLVGVTAIRLGARGGARQVGLFDEPRDPRPRAVALAVDQASARFGPGTVRRAVHVEKNRKR